jgi:hypothetical protein
MPIRVQRKRTKGWRMPDNAVYVGRPTKWGNPFRVSDYAVPIHCVEDFRRYVDGKIKLQGHYSGDLASGLFKAEIRHKLRGKDLACFCPLGQPCHADVLLEIANG